MKLEPVRLVGLGISGLKNVHNGSFRMPLAQLGQASMLGIYGQNGSGKTAVINALGILKALMSGNAVPKSAAELVTKGLDQISICAEFTHADKKIIYTINLVLTETGRIEVKNESLSCGRKSLRFLAGQKDFLLPKEIRTYTRSAKCDNDLVAYSILAVKDSRSFLFSNELILILKTISNKFNIEWYNCILRLSKYAFSDFFVIEDNSTAIINIGNLLPFSYRSNYEIGKLHIHLKEPTILNLDIYTNFKKAITYINSLLTSIVPKLSISLHEYGKLALKDSTAAMSFDIMTNIDGKCIPFRHESEGIKKIFSILGLLAAAFNDESVLVAIDEFDAGIFEYMLGEIIEVFHKYGKGQLIFTSHNLRPLEKLHHSSVVFTTTNKDNRYISLTNVKPSNNLRHVYLRSIFLGGQSEELYEDTSTINIRRAFTSYGGYLHGNKT